VSVKFVKNLLKRYRETGSVIPKPHGGGQTPKVKADGLNFLLKTVEKHPDFTRDEYTQIYNRHFPHFMVSNSTIGRGLRQLKLTRKKKTLSDPRKYEVTNQLKRKCYLALEPVELEQLIFLDETGATIHMIRDKARSPIRQRAYATQSLNRGTRISTIGARSHSGLVAELCFEGTLNTPVFNYFTENFLAPKLQPGNVVVLDNASSHNPDDIREILTPSVLQVLFLPPYSPELNPIELICSQVKIFLRKNTAKTTESLYQSLFRALERR